MVDVGLISRKLVLLMQSRKAIESYEIKSFDAFKKSHKDQKAVQKTLQEMVEICMDIGKHIIADENLRFPEDGRDIFSVLGDNGVITKKTVGLMHNMVGFRNIIVHLYEKIDLEIVFTVYKKHLKDFELFSSEISDFIRNRQ